jgi:transposase
MPARKKYPGERMDRGVRLVFESGRPIAHVAADLGVPPEALRERVRQAEADSGKRSDLLSTQEREEIRKLRREVHDLRRANEILTASVFFAKELDPDRTNGCTCFSGSCCLARSRSRWPALAGDGARAGAVYPPARWQAR